MRTILFAAASAALLLGCVDAAPTHDVEEDELVAADAGGGLTDDACKKLGEPWPGESLPATPENCAGPWSDDWDPSKPVCLGFGSDLDDCGNCNHLQLDDWSPGKNELYLDCAKAGLLPGQSGKNDFCFVTDPGGMTPPSKWPPYDGKPGQWTAREMCELGVPSPDSVEECRERGQCDKPDTGSGGGSDGSGS